MGVAEERGRIIVVAVIIATLVRVCWFLPFSVELPSFSFEETSQPLIMISLCIALYLGYGKAKLILILFYAFLSATFFTILFEDYIEWFYVGFRNMFFSIDIDVAEGHTWALKLRNILDFTITFFVMIFLLMSNCIIKFQNYQKMTRNQKKHNAEEANTIVSGAYVAIALLGVFFLYRGFFGLINGYFLNVGASFIVLLHCAAIGYGLYKKNSFLFRYLLLANIITIIVLLITAVPKELSDIVSTPLLGLALFFFAVQQFLMYSVSVNRMFEGPLVCSE